MEKTIWGSPAGKKHLAKKLAAMLPAHKIYVEPFAGSGAVLFEKQASEVEVINDKDPEIAFAFGAIKSLSDEDLESLGGMQWTGDKELFKQLSKEKPTDTLKRLHRFLYCTGFAYGKLRAASFNPSAEGSTLTAVKRAQASRDRLKSVQVFDKDYRDVVKEFDGEDTLFFFDPPYAGSNALDRVDVAEGIDIGEKKFDEESFFDVLKSIKGKFLVTYGVTGKTDWGDFSVKKIASRRRAMHTSHGERGPAMLEHLLIANYDVPSEDVAKALGDDYLVFPVVKGFPNGQAEAGVHMHALERESKRTKVDGAHTHLFWIDGELIETSEDGAHSHELHESDSDFDIWGGGEHFHSIRMPDGTVMETGFGASGHNHGLQVETTTFDGGHRHTLKLPGGRVVNSLMPGEFWRMTGELPQAENPGLPPSSVLAVPAARAGEVLSQLETFKAKTAVFFSDGNLYVDTDSDEILKSVEFAVGRMLPSHTGEKVSVVKGRPNSPRVEVADIVISIRKDFSVSEEVEDVEKRIVFRDGEYCAVSEDGSRNFGCFPTRAQAARRLGQVESFKSEDGVPGVLAWSAVSAGHMPPDGQSFLPPKIEEVIPPKFRYWKSQGEEARKIRDALFDAQLVTKDSVAVVDGEPCLVQPEIYVVAPGDIDESVTPIRRTTKHEISCLVDSGCAWWSSGDVSGEAIDRVEKSAGAKVVHAVEAEGPIREVVKRASSWSFDYILMANDSVAARAEMSKYGNPFIVKKSAMRGLVCMSNATIAKADIEFVGNGSADLGDHEFRLEKQDWDGHVLWHLSIAGDRWTLQGDPTSGERVTALKDAAGSLSGSVTCVDSGRGAFIERDVDSMSIRFDGRQLDGVVKMSRVGGSSVWSFQPAEVGRVEKTYKVQLLKQDEEGEERFVMGVVLEPDEVDSQDDTISAPVIREAAHRFMAEFQNIGIQHQELTDKVQILESYLSPVSFEVGSEVVKQGTWLLGVRVLDDALWQAVKAGEFTGFSIGGTAVRTPEN